jgi:FMN phosphatase YigB (HAD superfamily)
MLVVFDLDGTLADCEHRRHYFDQTPCDWESFHREAYRDEPIAPMVDLFDKFLGLGDTVLICTGRPLFPHPRGETTQLWLEKHRIFPTEVFHRDTGDYRPDDVIKQEMLAKIIEKYGSIPDIVFEDRKRVVDMWRRNGIFCCQVADGNF